MLLVQVPNVLFGGPRRGLCQGAIAGPFLHYGEPLVPVVSPVQLVKRYRIVRSFPP